MRKMMGSIAVRIQKTFFVVTLLCVAVLMGCGEKEALEKQIKDVESQRSASEQRLTSQNQKITALQNQSNQLASDKRANHNKTLAFMRNNIGTVGCLAVAGIVISDDNAFSKDVKELSGAVGLICLGVFLFSEDFRKNVDLVVTELNAASKRDKALKAQVDALQPKIEAEQKIWSAEKKEFDRLTSEISGLRTRLAELVK
jgi:septal ring factor EnvC (AmiA/AmiB activator)